MEKIHNFRDFGGYRTRTGSMVKKGLLYRCGSLANATDNDLKKLTDLRVKTIIDLRTNQEKSNNPDRIPNNANINLIHIPIKVTMHNESGFIWQLLSLRFGKGRKLNYDVAMRDVYREYVTAFGAEFSAILKLASDNRNLPLLIHCVGGKDRTGFACSLLQLALDVPFDSVMQDYLHTNDFLYEVKDEFRNRLRKFSYFGISQDKFIPLFEARRDYLEAAYDQIRSDFSTVDDYLRNGLGLSDADRMKLQELLLDT